MHKLINKVCFWRGEPEVLVRYAKLLSEVFDKSILSEQLTWKHIENPLGLSVIAYIENEDGKMVAARAFWKMYSPEVPLYQPCDTVTHPSYQGQGLFKRLTLACLEHVEANAVMLNFPNNNSFPAYLKLGWQLLAGNKRVFNFKIFQNTRRVDNLFDTFGGVISQNYLTFLDWRYGNKSFGKYRLWRNNNNLIIDNGQQCGVLALDSQHMPNVAINGFSQGYLLDILNQSNVSPLQGSIALNCNSRTAYFLKGNSSLKSIEAQLSSTQVNLLMDTF